MARDASLDDFSTSDGTEGGEGDGGTADTADTSAEPSDDPHRNPAERADAQAPGQLSHSTYTWSPDGESCEACGAVVGRRWRDSDGLVCEACKSW